MWDSLRLQLERTHRVLVPDLPGHGKSAPEPYVSHSQTVQQLSDLLTNAVPGSPATVVGFSLGAQLAVLLASDHPELIDRAVIISAQAKPMPFANLTLSALSVAAPLARKRWFATLQARELFIPGHLMEDYISTSAGVTRESLLAAVGENMRFEVPEKWHTFPGRSLVMVGQRERRLMRDSARVIHAALPTSELEIVDNFGHGIPLQRPDWFDKHIAVWLSAT